MIYLYLVWFMVMVFFMVVMVVLPGSSKKTWPALGGSTKEHSNDLHKTQVSKSKGKANKSTNHFTAVAKLFTDKIEERTKAC